MLGISGLETIVILFVVFLLFGGLKHLPSIARFIFRAIKLLYFRKR